MRSLVNNVGSLETARSRQYEQTSKNSVTNKMTLMIWELQKYNIFAAGISETKWFGSNIYEVEGHAILHSG